MGKDFYVVLKVTPEATAEQIRSAYKRRALEVHPDRSGADSESFLELQKAYSVLSDRRQRAAYDRSTQSIETPGARRRTGAEPFRAVEAATGFRDVSLSHSFSSFSPSFDEIFDRLWSNFGRLSRPKAERVESLDVEVPLSPRQAFAGGSVRIMVPSRVTCEACHGRGGIGLYECWQCRGQGAVIAEFPVEVDYPAGLRRDYAVRLGLDDFGIQNFYLTVRFRPAARIG
jgi:DnaJ-class molecular chaperone